LSTATTVPSPNAIRKTCQTCTWWLSVKIARVVAIEAMPTCVAIRMRRFGYRSASTPPARPNSKVGRNCNAVVMPTAVALPVMLSTSQSWAMRCTQAPVFETSWPVAKRRKFRVLSEANVDGGAAAGALNDHPKLVACGFSAIDLRRPVGHSPNELMELVL